MFTLYFQENYGTTLGTFSSNDLLRLMKIESMTMHGRRGFINNSYIVDEHNKVVSACELSYDDLFALDRFETMINNGKYFKSYDYAVKL